MTTIGPHLEDSELSGKMSDEEVKILHADMTKICSAIARIEERMKDIVELSSELRSAQEELSDVKSKISVLEVKSGFWGVIGGAIASIPIALTIARLLVR